MAERSEMEGGISGKKVNLCLLIETYFAPEARPMPAESGEITAESFQYSLNC